MHSKAKGQARCRPTERQPLKCLHVLISLGVAVLAIMAFVSLGYGQEYQGSITGLVTDSSGAAIVGASVQVVNEQTHFVTPAVSNGTGSYSAPFLMPGTYDVKVGSKGFAPNEQTGVVLVAGANKVVDFTLHPGQVSASVTVTANQEMLETGSATVETVISPHLLDDAPNAGDNPFYVATRTVPGLYSNQVQSTQLNDTPQSNGASSGMAFNGKGGLSLVQVDGIVDTMMNGNPNLDGNAGVAPPPYTMQELNVKTSEFDAQYGHTDGGIQDIILKNGTPAFHGAAYFVDGNTDFDANRWERNGLGIGRSSNDWVEEGFAVTGPVRIPKLYHGRDRTYFMVGWNHYFFTVGQISDNSELMSVPTLLERKGDFSELVNAGGVIYDPTTTVPLGAPSNYASWCAGNPAVNGHPAGCNAGERESFTQEYGEGAGNTALCNGDVNCIPQSRWNTAGATLAGALPPTGYTHAIYPVPNATSTNPKAPYLSDYYAPHMKQGMYYHSIVARLDHEFNDNNKVHFTFIRDALNNIGSEDAGFPDDELGSTYVPQILSFSGGIIDYTKVISPTQVLDVHAGGMYHPYHLTRAGMNFNPTNLGMTGALPVPLQNFPGTSVSGVGGGYQGLQNGVGADDIASFAQGDAIWSKSLARMNIKAGYEYIMNRSDSIGTTSNLGTFSSSLAFTQNYVASGANPTDGEGDGMASLLLGYSSGNGSSTTIYPRPALGWHYQALYVQDDWRVNSRLTVNFGLRYDYESEVTERHNWMNASFNFGAQQPFCLPNALGTGISSCAAPPVSPTVPQGYFGGLTFLSSSNRLPFTRELQDRFQPRFGASYRITDRDVLRGGFGILFAPAPVAQTNDGYTANTTYVASTNSNYTPTACTSAQGGDALGFCTLTNPFPSGVVQPTGNVLGLSTFLGQGIGITDQHHVYPKATIYSVELEHQFPSQLLLSLSYHGAYTSGIGVTKNINALPACYYAGGGCAGAGITSLLNAQVANPMSGYLPASSGLNAAKLPQQDFYVPYPEFGAINVTYTYMNGNQRAGTQNYNAMFAQITKRVTHGLEFSAAVTWAKIMDQLAFTNPTDLNPGKYEDSQPARLMGFVVVYDLPKATTTNPVARGILNGWQLSAAENWQQNSGVGNPGGAFSTGVIPYAKHQTPSHWFNNCYIPVISQATPTTPVVYGQPMHDGQPGCQDGEQPAWIQQPNFTLNQINGSTLMRNIRYPSSPLAYLNSGLARTFPIREQLSLSFRADAFNTFNHPNLIGSIQTGLTSSTFGQDTGLTENNDPRFLRLRAVLNF